LALAPLGSVARGNSRGGAALAGLAGLAGGRAAEAGPLAYLADVDADQVDAQIATLDAAIAAVTAHKNTLP